MGGLSENPFEITHEKEISPDEKKHCSVPIPCALPLAGCGGQSAPTADAVDLADRLSTQIQFEDTLSPLEGDMLYTLYGIDQKDVQQGAAYVSTGATAEEIAVFSCTDDSAAQRVESALKQRVDSQKQSYVDYVPKEMTKLNDAVLIRRGNLVALCISNDNATAKQLIQG